MRYESITEERLNEMLSYDPQTGIFTWKTRPYRNSRKKAGDVAGILKHTGSGSYRYIGLDNRTYLASQLAFLMANGRWAIGYVGFKNGDPSDLRAENLIEHLTVTGPNKHDLNTKEGRSAYKKDYWDQNPNYRRNLGLKRHYDIDMEEYQRMFVAQGGVCAICKKAERATQNGKVRWLSVDHRHSDGRVRGLLCSNCNTLIGWANEDVQRIEMAIQYLEKHKRPSNLVTVIEEELKT